MSSRSPGADASPAEPIQRIVLVGFMGAGKSAVGAQLAAVLGWPHLDLDAWVEAAAGCAVAEIFAREGEAAFRVRETAATVQAAARSEVVVSTGGGWVLNPAHWQALRQGSLIVWLRTRLDVALARARADGGTRPLLAADDPSARAAALLRERQPLYAAADLTVDTDDLSPAAAAAEILRHLHACLPRKPSA